MEWRLPPDASERARAFLEAGEPWPKTEFGPVSVTLHYRFRWVDLETHAVLPGQTAERRAHWIQATSNLSLTLDRSSSIIFTGRFPFAQPDAEFIAYVKQVAPYMPMAFLARRFGSGFRRVVRRRWVTRSAESTPGSLMESHDNTRWRVTSHFS